MGTTMDVAVMHAIEVRNSIDHGMNAAAAVAAPRIHNQWLPDEVRVENGISADVLEILRERGHRIVTPLSQTSANTIAITPDGLARKLQRILRRRR